MARILITGSADGLGMMAAQSLVKQGHRVVIHARNHKRAKEAQAVVPGAETCLVADLASIQETKNLAADVNKLGRFDAVIHNAGLGFQQSSPGWTADGIASVFAVNSLAPYILTCLIEKPQKLIYVSSGLHRSGEAVMAVDDLTWKSRRWNGFQAYSDSKLHNIILANAVARRWKDVKSNAVEPGWVATKMGGAGAPDSLEDGPKTQVWLATSEDPAANVSGKYFYHQQLKGSASIAQDQSIQDQYLKACEEISGVKFPA